MSNTCKYWDCGWCYAPDNVETNADSQSACVNPSLCPYLMQAEAMRPQQEKKTDNTVQDTELIQRAIRYWEDNQ